MEEKKSSFIRDFLIITLSVLIAITCMVALNGYGFFSATNKENETQTELTVAQVAEKAIACSVSVLTRTDGSISYFNSAGSGVILRYDEDSKVAYAISNDHVIASSVEGATYIYYLNQYYPATIVGTDPENDISVLAFKPGFYPVVAEIGRCLTALQVGEQVVAVGNAAGLDYTVTDGVISFVGRVEDVSGINKNYVQTSAVINNGNSGGGLFDMQGKLIAINTLGLANYDDINFSLPIRFDSEVALSNTNYDQTRRDALTSFNCLIDSYKQLVAQDSSNLVGYISGQKYIGAKFETLTRTTLTGGLLKTAYVNGVYSYFNLEGNLEDDEKWQTPRYATTTDTKNILIDTISQVRYSTDNGAHWSIAFVESSSVPDVIVYLANANFNSIDIYNFVNKQSIGTIIEFTVDVMNYNNDTGAVSYPGTTKTIKSKVTQYQFEYAQ